MLPIGGGERLHQAVELGTDRGWNASVVASAAGAAGHPAWYYNVAANPGKVGIELRGEKIPVTAEELHGAEREDAWRRITTASPRFAKYQEKTDRELPVIRLTPRAPA